jgi:hypothetical protein
VRKYFVAVFSETNLNALPKEFSSFFGDGGIGNVEELSEG